MLFIQQLEYSIGYIAEAGLEFLVQIMIPTQ
jgi:hypothetical protein